MIKKRPMSIEAEVCLEIPCLDYEIQHRIHRL